MKIIVKMVLIALVLLGVTQYSLIPGISVSSFATAVVVSLILGVLNVFIKPILLLLTLPVNLLTLGLFTFVINAFLFGLFLSSSRDLRSPDLSPPSWARLLFLSSNGF